MELSPRHSDDWEDEEEGEPLFADDVVNSDEEDPPPLPPPMPSLSQLPQHHPATPHTPAGVRGAKGRGGGVGDWSNVQRTPATGGADQGSGDQATQKKRAPVLTLTIDRIFSEKGLSRIEKEFPKLKFKGKGHEVGDLSYLMQQYEHWANALYPKLTFKDVTDRIEKLATKKEFKSQLIQMRRRWARGPTPPITDDNDSGDIANNDRHGNNSSTNHHPGNSPTNEGSGELQLNPERDVSKNRSSTTSDYESEDEPQNDDPPSNGRNLPTNGEEEEMDKYDELLMRESEILREGEERRTRKRERSSDGSDQDEEKVTRSPGTEGSREPLGREGDKRLRLSCEPRDLLDDMLAEEEEFMDESSFDQVPPGFDA